MKRKNVLIIYTDQQRVDTLGCYGNDKAITPNIDALAKDGILFDQYYVQNPVCMASRMSFLTGRYPASLGIGCNGTPLTEDAITLNRILKPYGYHTGNLGKLHFQPHAKANYKNVQADYGFDTFILSEEPGCYDDAYTKWVELKGGKLESVRTSLPPEAKMYGKKEYSLIPRETHEPYAFPGDEGLSHTDFVTDEVCTYIDNHKHGPFMAIAGYYAPHTPVNPPQKYLDMYKNLSFDPPVVGKEETVMDALADLTLEEWKEVRRFYMAFVTQVDDQVGKLISKLKEVGIYEDTIIVFTSDHGEYLGDHGRIQKGMPGHDCIINVPLIIRNPGHADKGLVTRDLFEGVDVVPTILDWCGIQVPESVQGKSMSSYVQNLQEGCEDGGGRNSILVDYFEPIRYRENGLISRSTTIRTKEFMYNVSDEGELLYDLKKDPNQLENVCEKEAYRLVLSDLRLELIKRLQTACYVDRNRPEKY